MKTRITIATMILAAGSLLISAPASARDGHYDKRDGYHQRDFPAYKYDRNRDRDHRKYDDRRWHKYQAQKKHRDWKHHGRHEAKRFGHRHHDHYRKQMVIISADRHRAYHHHHSSGLSTITGGVIGAIVGNHVGNGDPVATGIGVVTGAVIGNHIGR